jgi:hypothetical protein
VHKQQTPLIFPMFIENNSGVLQYTVCNCGYFVRDASNAIVQCVCARDNATAHLWIFDSAVNLQGVSAHVCWFLKKTSVRDKKCQTWVGLLQEQSSATTVFQSALLVFHTEWAYACGLVPSACLSSSWCGCSLWLERSAWRSPFWLPHRYIKTQIYKLINYFWHPGQ